MCWYEAFPAVKWFSSTDVTEPSIGLTCSFVEHPPGGTSLTHWYDLWKLTKLIEGFPW